MSQPRRRRRRRKKPSGEGARPRGDGGQVREQASQLDGSRSARSRNRKRRRRGGEQTTSPRSSEDLVRALPRERPATLTAPPDGQSLETIIGELQSNYGVPAYPQEYRITIKVAEERESRAPAQPAAENGAESERPAAEGAPRREKAPAAPRVSPEGGEESPAPAKSRRRRNRRKRGRGGSAGPSGGAGSAPSGPPPPP